jgi:hypothetical protein
VLANRIAQRCGVSRGRRSRKPAARFRLKHHSVGSIGVVSFTRCRIEPDEANKSREATMSGPALAYRYPRASTLQRNEGLS